MTITSGENVAVLGGARIHESTKTLENISIAIVDRI